MNLPIKLVDLVTLLFGSLLIVIIIFITLQRNIKRFKLRNIKDPHFLLCKSIPRDLKDKIIRKHVKSNTHVDPPMLLTKNYANQRVINETNIFILRFKAFDTSKWLENALMECGYVRPAGVKFEDFIETLIDYSDSALPKDLLDKFHRLYLWCVLDPMPFQLEQLRDLNRLINQIIEHLAINIHDCPSEQILSHRLELDAHGNFDVKRYWNSEMAPRTGRTTVPNKMPMMAVPPHKAKEVKFSGTRTDDIEMKRLRRPKDASMKSKGSKKESKATTSEGSSLVLEKAATSEAVKDSKTTPGFEAPPKRKKRKQRKEQHDEQHDAVMMTKFDLEDTNNSNEQAPLVLHKATPQQHQKKKSDADPQVVQPETCSIADQSTTCDTSLLVTPRVAVKFKGAENAGFNETTF